VAAVALFAARFGQAHRRELILNVVRANTERNSTIAGGGAKMPEGGLI
jgi:hypothetical protein